MANAKPAPLTAGAVMEVDWYLVARGKGQTASAQVLQSAVSRLPEVRTPEDCYEAACVIGDAVERALLAQIGRSVPRRSGDGDARAEGQAHA